jgi:hypothetical protein
MNKFKNKIKLTIKNVIGTSIGCQFGLFFVLDFSSYEYLIISNYPKFIANYKSVNFIS